MMGYRIGIVLTFAFACSKQQPPPEPVQLAEFMKTHFAHAEDMRDAIVNGDFVTLHDRARALAEPVPVADLPEAWDEHLGAIRATARNIVGEYSPEKAAIGFANLAQTCANCHQMTGSSLPIATYPIPPADADIQTHMLRHAWAAARMWEGLIAPSDERWEAGAKIVAAEPLEPKTYLGKSGPASLAAMGENLHRIGINAVSTKTQTDRARIYADFIGKCSTCHGAVRNAKSQQ